MKNLHNSVLTVTMAIGLAITGLTPAHASTHTIAATQQEELQSTQIQAERVAVSYEKPTVVTTPAPATTAPVEAVQPQTSESTPTAAKVAAAPVTPAAPVAAPKVVEPTPTPAPAAARVAAPAVSGNAVAAAALAQVGINQDCTMLVTNALAAIGIHFHGWPADYMSLGHIIPAAAAQPGDLIYYANGGTGMAHIAVYIGNGMAVHGGFDGTTKVFSANVGSGPVFIRIG